MCKLLIVDDNPHIINVIERVGIFAGLEVASAKSYKEAVKLLHTYVPHIILIDIMLPGKKGTELLKEPMEFPAVPLIFTGTHVSSEQLLDAIRHGAIAVITKPASIEILEAYFKLAAKIAESRMVEHSFGSMVGGMQELRKVVTGAVASAMVLQEGVRSDRGVE